MKTRLVSFLCCASILTAVLCSAGLADTYPSRPIRIIVPAAAGGVMDVLARGVADRLTHSLGQSVIVDNRPGAGGIVGTELAAKAKPDGYTLLLGTSSILCINPSLYGKLPYDPVKDFIPVTLAVRGSPLLLVNLEVPVKTLAEFIAFAKARPGQLTYGTPGNGSAQHLAGELL